MEEYWPRPRPSPWAAPGSAAAAWSPRRRAAESLAHAAKSETRMILRWLRNWRREACPYDEQQLSSPAQSSLFSQVSWELTSVEQPRTNNIIKKWCFMLRSLKAQLPGVLCDLLCADHDLPPWLPELNWGAERVTAFVVTRLMTISLLSSKRTNKKKMSKTEITINITLWSESLQVTQWSLHYRKQGGHSPHVL